MGLFLVDEDTGFEYEDLLNKINTSSYYMPLLKTDALYDYFINLLTALVSNKPLILIDSDMSEEEITGLAIGKVNESVEIKKKDLLNIEELLQAVRSSRSEITIFTSGTTGQPKKVIHTVSSLTRSVRCNAKYEKQIWLFAYNPTHMAGLQVFFQAFFNQNVLVNVFNKARNTVFEMIKRYHVTHISATPTFYRLLFPVDQFFETVQRVTLGGEKSENRLYESIMKMFPSAKLNNIYASTEAGTLFVAKGENFQIPVSLMDKCKIVEGELLIHKSLLGQSDSFDYKNDFYSTGDLVEWVNETDGLFRFISRKNELINVGGYKVNPGEVEEYIVQIPDIEQALVIGKPNSVLGNILCAEVKKNPESNLTEMDIRKYLSGKLQDFKIPRKIKFVENFSLTRTGKLKRS
ncbi:ANL family adenylate-forming protein [Parabacteroides goldsteinii]|uniref:AMP-dependent synthetase/ligase domain-containing protein n=1 Tax=Parabacteroides goldsteinii CL02T12C30 TaxID=999418 RepID=K5Z1J9_9BACT|nr:fatty acid--CoA ligase family protein [Parabacteroides goldsteinii]EKN09389.1 hypothetical protein HMPREF1076_04418 [Parabacteroides goldsteinii CL02T12C30]